LSSELESPANGTKSYAKVRARFERDVVKASGSWTTWPEGIAATIRAALAVGAADPSTAYRLTEPASGRRSRDHAAFVAAVEDLGARLRHGAPGAMRAERPARNLVLRVARQVCLQLENRPGEALTEIAPDLIVLALTPCVGLAEARRLAAQPIETS
jgi:hypothetical protein